MIPRSAHVKLWALLVLTAAPLVADGGSPALTEERIRAVTAVNEAYATAWLAGDPDAVLAVFSDDAVLLPPGQQPLAGKPAIRAFFWPAGGPPMRVLEFRYVPQEVAGSGGLAYARGTFTLTFEMGTSSEAKTYSNVGNYMMLLEEGTAGGWKVTRYIWNSAPRNP